MTAEVALATCAGIPDGDADDRLLIAPLAARGVRAVPAVWDDPAVHWASFDGVVVRSTWDYPPRRHDFVSWARQTAQVTRLWNPTAVLEWNTDKRYLRDLEEGGVPVLPTTFVQPGGPVVLPAGDYVVKPAVSAGAKDTARYGPGQEDTARAHAQRLHAGGRVVMLQPYAASVDEHGETALVYLDGTFSHAIRKGPLLRRGGPEVRGLYAPEEITPRQPNAAERAVGEAVMDAVPAGRDALLYARVDLVGTPEGPLLLELELTEPSLFLATASGAADRLASSVAGRLA